MNLFFAKFDGGPARGGGGARGVSQTEQILSRYTHEEQRVIAYNLNTLAATAKFMGQDFEMRVSLNKPGEGWHWNFAKNEIRVDPETMLRDPINVSRAIYCHEGFHRRITPKDGVPENEWKQPGLPFLVNSIEDPRIENFGGEAYPSYRPLRDASYEHHAQKAKDAAAEHTGRVPRHVQAGLALIDQWFREARGLEFDTSEIADPFVREFVDKALSHAQKAWHYYPTKSEIDWEPEKSRKYFDKSYGIIREKIWPDFQKLYEQDKEDELINQGFGGEPGTSKEPLSEDEVRDLLERAKRGEFQPGQEGNPAEGRPIDPSLLSPELQRELREFLENLPPEKLSELRGKANQALEQASSAASEALEGAATQEARRAEERGKDESATSSSDDFAGIDLAELRKHASLDPAEQAKIREEFAELLNKDRGLYLNTVREISPIINELENDLRAIFQKRKKSHRETGKQSGPTFNVSRYIREKVSGRHPIDTRAFEKKTRPLANDYAVMILVDVSGSMENNIHHAFAATVACTEVFSRLKISHAICGFNDEFYRYKNFDNETDPATLEMMEQHVHTPAAQYNNDGWALQQARNQLLKAPEKEKILVVLSDGQPVPSNDYTGSEYDLKTTAEAIEASRKVRLIGLGMGPGTEHVKEYYKNNRADVPIEDLPEALAEVLRELIEGR